MEAVRKRKQTAAEYLETERLAETKSEFFDGEVFNMAGGTRSHSQVAVNLSSSLWSQLRNKGCLPLNSDMRLKVQATGLYAYPDVQVVCGQAQYEDERQDTLLNPTLIVEVLSPSTAAWDRGQKFWHYRHIESLQQYVLVTPDQTLVEVFTRQSNGAWLLDTYDESTSQVRLSSINCEVPVSDIYLGMDVLQSGSR